MQIIYVHNFDLEKRNYIQCRYYIYYVCYTYNSNLFQMRDTDSLIIKSQFHVKFHCYNIIMINFCWAVSGPMIRAMTDNMIAAQNPTAAPSTKIYLYSGHESNIAAMLHALGVYRPHVPEYSSAVILELQQIEQEYYVKVSVLSQTILSLSTYERRVNIKLIILNIHVIFFSSSIIKAFRPLSKI